MCCGRVARRASAASSFCTLGANHLGCWHIATMLGFCRVDAILDSWLRCSQCQRIRAFYRCHLLAESQFLAESAADSNAVASPTRQVPCHLRTASSGIDYASCPAIEGRQRCSVDDLSSPNPKATCCLGTSWSTPHVLCHPVATVQWPTGYGEWFTIGSKKVAQLGTPTPLAPTCTARANRQQPRRPKSWSSSAYTATKKYGQTEKTSQA